MSDWVRWTLPAAAVAAVASPAYAVVYLSVGAAQKAAFPSATSFVDHDGRSWKAMAGDRFEHRLRLIGPREPCSSIAARARAGYVLAEPVPPGVFARPPTIERCLAHVPPAFQVGGYRIYRGR